MLEWITANSDMLNLAANWAMVGIWLVYLQVFLQGFRRQTLPKIVINRAAGSSLDAACFVSNMSSDAIYIESVLVRIDCDGEALEQAVTDFDFFDDTHNGEDPKQRTYQGTLAPAQYTSLGRFGELIESVAKRTGRDYEKLKSSGDLLVEITIIADYAAENLLIGARRKFHALWQDDRWKLTPETPDTQQIRSRSERKRIRDMLAAME